MDRAKTERSPIPVLFEDEHFILTPCVSHPVPGYLILSSKDSMASIGGLAEGPAARLGDLIARAVRAIETTVDTDRVYTLSFGESEGPFHLHLFPRTAWVLEAFQKDYGSLNGPVDGPELFVWARRHLRNGSQSLGDRLRCREACEQIRSLLDSNGSSRRESGVHLQAERLERP